MASQVGAQLFTLREHCKTPSDFAETCERLRHIGFEAVQVSALGFDDAAEIKRILDDHGLRCAATHRTVDHLRETDAALDWHRTLGCELTAIGGFGFGGATRRQWLDFIADFNRVAQRLEAAGLHVGYHNHSHELAPLTDDPASIRPDDTALHLLLAELDPAVWFEIDTYWIAHGGGDPAAWIRRCQGRLPAVHVKDMTVTPTREQKMCEVGSGNLNWPAILEACREAGVQWYLIERDRGDLDPFESLRISLENLRAMGVE